MTQTTCMHHTDQAHGTYIHSLQTVMTHRQPTSTKQSTCSNVAHACIAQASMTPCMTPCMTTCMKSSMLTVASSGGLLHDGKGDGTFEGIRNLKVFQMLRHTQWRRPMHLLMSMIPIPMHQKH